MSIRSQYGGMVALLVFVFAAMPSWAQQQDAATQWADFNHYVLVARPDLAQAAGQALLDQDSQALLDVVEASEYANYDRTLQRAQRTEGLGEIARQLDQKIQLAKIDRSREPKRITSDIEQLAQGQRPYSNAVARLKAAGQYAAPQLLATLRDEGKSNLHPYVLQAMAAIGRPLVAPLSEALPQLDPVNQSRVAQVLAEIGYPHPLPYLKQVIDSSSADPDAKRTMRKAYSQLLERTELPSDLDASTLFLLLGESQYRRQTQNQEIAGFDPADGNGIVWHYAPKTGLVAVPVPGAIFGDVLAMRAAETALSLDPSLDAALSLYLMANLRRENNIPEGASDPSYGSDRQDPMFYALLAGPQRLQDVLARALADHDADLAIDAIEALGRTAGIKDQAGSSGDKPLLAALSSPDPRVRFAAAAALASANPTENFPGADRVVPVLAEALRPTDVRVALVLADDQQTLNDLVAGVQDLGYESISGLNLAETAEPVAAAGSVNVIVTAGAVASIQNTLEKTRSDYRLGAVPVLAVVTPAQQADLASTETNNARLTSTLLSGDAEELVDTLDEALALLEPQTLNEEDAQMQAFASLRLLANVAMASEVYHVEDALPALATAVGSEDEQIVTGAGVVLSLIGEARAQDALAEAALGQASVDVQVALLDSLANSATHFGNHLSQGQTDRLLKIVLDSSDDTALAAARAHGALALPTSNSVQEILKK